MPDPQPSSGEPVRFSHHLGAAVVIASLISALPTSTLRPSRVVAIVVIVVVLVVVGRLGGAIPGVTAVDDFEVVEGAAVVCVVVVRAPLGARLVVGGGEALLAQQRPPRPTSEPNALIAIFVLVAQVQAVSTSLVMELAASYPLR